MKAVLPGTHTVGGKNVRQTQENDYGLLRGHLALLGDEEKTVSKVLAMEA